jgi:hypothetical protein
MARPTALYKSNWILFGVLDPCPNYFILDILRTFKIGLNK